MSIRRLTSCHALLALLAISLVVASSARPASSSQMLAVAPNGSDTNSCTLAAPCRSFDRAYHVAAAGAVVQVAAGSYPAQSISTDPSKDAALANVLFQPAPGASVTLANSTLKILAAHVEFD